MAAEKQTDSRQSIVDQDAAITAYLDGLLRDPYADETAENNAPRKSPGLKVINVPEPLAASDSSADESRMRMGGDAPPESATTVVAPSVPDVEPSAASNEPEEMDDGADDPDAPARTASDVASEETPVAVPDSSVTPAEPFPESEGRPAVTTDSTDVAQDAHWGWLRIGGMIMAIPADAIESRYPAPDLEPVPGAPSHVAGALPVDGRPRLILSLATLTGMRGRADAETEVLLLGKGGLWGVVGERVEQPPELDDESVEWRNEVQRTARRAWLAGTASVAGVAVLDVAGLRAALKASR
ncbi:chemotaxis protein CheW [Guyparkeria sp.]|uniref:chemotaxis protein CheW n=1 Tax=Guyparkeria sp. TaxID=2035736 RepID=UPI00397050C4